MSKNLVICLDGTGAQPKAVGNTNVVRLYSMLDLSDPSKQIAYYDPGVGTFAAAGAWTRPARWWSRMLGLAFGNGLKENLGEAYAWLMDNWELGDHIYVFGFSRGAYNARALVGILRTLGLLRRGSENFVPYVVSAYSGGLDDMHEIAKTFAQKADADGHLTPPVRYLGVWDTVKAAGLFRGSITWPYTRQLPNAQRIRHAMSIDERRRPFREYAVTGTDDVSREEVLFAGVHSDVGGTFAQKELSTIALKWVAEGAVAEGLLVKRQKYAFECKVDESFATGTLHKNAWPWKLLGIRRRPVRPDARVHASVKARIDAGIGYAPFGATPVVYVDADWAAPKKGA